MNSLTLTTQKFKREFSDCIYNMLALYLLCNGILAGKH